jgi:hypothetical protein
VSRRGASIERPGNRWKIRGLVVAIGAGALAGGCGGGSAQRRPVASVASSKEAAAAFAPLRDAWSPDPKDRSALEPKLVAFVARFPNDGLTPLVRTYLAFALIDMGDLKEASVQLARLDGLPAGSTDDLAEIARAKLLRIRGQPGAAFERVRALVGKLVDPVSRAILNEEISLAAVEAKRDYEAIAYMDAWLRNASEEDHDTVKDEVTAAIAKEPDAVLQNALRAMRTGGAASGYGREIQRIVSERLGAVALARNDSDLARWLVSGETSAAPLLGTDEGALGELATTKRGLANVDGRTIGLVLPTGSTDLRDEAAAIMRGVAWALDLPRSDPSKGDRTKLATRDDGGDANRVEPTMSELAGEGAALIVAALDPVSAERAVKWGEANDVTVIALAVPRAPSGATDAGAPDAGVAAPTWAFVAGQRRDAEIGALAEEFVSRAVVKIVPIVPPSGSEAILGLARGSVELQPPVACDTAAAQSGEAHFPVDDWKSARVHAWLVDAPSECARDLLRGLGAASLDGTVALTLDAAGTTARAPNVKELAVRVGEVPVTAASADLVADPEVRAWFAREGAPPSWWSALGHDAAALARVAVATLPLDATTDPKEVGSRRLAARTALAAARAHLWTSDAQGFSPSHDLPRDVKVVELPAVLAKPGSP